MWRMFFDAFPRREILTPAEELSELIQNNNKNQTVRYSSLEHGSLDDMKRHKSGSQSFYYKKDLIYTNNNWASQNSLAELVDKKEMLKKNGRKVFHGRIFNDIEKEKDNINNSNKSNSKKNRIIQPEKDSYSILPFYNSKSKLDISYQTPIQSEYIETIKVKFFNLGLTTGASLQ